MFIGHFGISFGATERFRERRWGRCSSARSSSAVEGAVFAVGLWLYVRSTIAVDRSGRYGTSALIVLLLLIYAANLAGPPPPGDRAIAWAGQAQWLLILLGYWIDRHRRVAVDRSGTWM